MILEGEEVDFDALDALDSGHLTYGQRQALLGVGDAEHRAAQDALLDCPEGMFGVGDRVSFALPGAARKNGTLVRIVRADAMVELARGECALVPVMALEPPSNELDKIAKHAEIKALIKRDQYPIRIVATREVEDGLYEAQLQYAARLSPSEDDIFGLLSSTFVRDAVSGHALQIVDGESEPGRMRVKFRVAQESRRSPGLYGEGLEGDGASVVDPTQAACTAQLESVQASHPDLHFEVTGENCEEGRTELKFAVHECKGETTRPLRINKSIKLTASKAHSVAAVGRVVADAFGVRVFVDSPHGEVSWSSLRKGAFDDMQSPNTPRFDMGQAQESQQPLKVDQADKGADDREHLGGPGLMIAEVGKPTKKYWNKLYENDPEYGKALTEDVEAPKPKISVREEIRAAFALEGRRVSATAVTRIVAILADTSKVKTAQLDNLVGGFLSARSHPQLQKHVDKLVIDYLAAYPDGLNRAGNNAYATILSDAVNYFQKDNPKRLESLRLKVAPTEDVVDTSGQPGLWQRFKERVSPVEKALSMSEKTPDDARRQPQAPATSVTQQPAPMRNAPRDEPLRPRPVRPQMRPGLQDAPMPAPIEARAAKTKKPVPNEARPMLPAFGDIGMRADPAKIFARGSYVFAEVTWDPKRLKGASVAQIQQLAVSFLKMVATTTRVIDLGFVAGVRVADIDCGSGRALLQFRSSLWQSFPQQVQLT